MGVTRRGKGSTLGRKRKRGRQTKNSASPILITPRVKKASTSTPRYVSVITVAANKKHCKKRMAKLKKCFEKGYQPAIFTDCKAGSKAIKKRKTKKCAEIEAKVFENQKCGQFQCESKTNGWTPIFNTTSPRVALFNISEFKVKFTENKRTDKFLYLSVNVNIYDVEGNETGHTNLNLYATKKGDKTIFTGFKRFYTAGPLNDCSRYMTLNYLTDFNFEMTTSVSQSEMFQFTLPNGSVYTEDMMECAYFSDWKEVLKEGVEAAVKLETLIPDLEEYYSTEYMVV